MLNFCLLFCDFFSVRTTRVTTGRLGSDYNHGSTDQLNMTDGSAGSREGSLADEGSKIFLRNFLTEKINLYFGFFTPLATGAPTNGEADRKSLDGLI